MYAVSCGSNKWLPVLRSVYVDPWLVRCSLCTDLLSAVYSTMFAANRIIGYQCILLLLFNRIIACLYSFLCLSYLKLSRGQFKNYTYGVKSHLQTPLSLLPKKRTSKQTETVLYTLNRPPGVTLKLYNFSH